VFYSLGQNTFIAAKLGRSMFMLHYRHIATLLVFAASVGFATRLPAQVEFEPNSDSKGPDFHVDLVNTAVAQDSPLSRLNVYLELAYDDLQFVKLADAFEASYEVTVTIFDKDNDQVDGKLWKETPLATSFDMTNKRNRFSQSHRFFDLEPGQYKVQISVQDIETHRTTARSKNIELSMFSGAAFQSSDITLISEMAADSASVISIRPQVSDASKGVIDSTLAFMELYAADVPQEVKVAYELAGKSTRHRVRRSFSQALTAWRNPIYFSLHADSLPHDIYTLKIEVASGKANIKEEKEFYVRWSSLPSTASDLKTAIEQLRYIANKEEWKRLSKAKGDARVEEFKKFWLRRDPSPGTEANEGMDLYYSRIEFANQRFSVMQRPGWRTDMGVLFIILGSPDDVERNVYPRYSKPYEIWTYYQYNRQFIFLDYTGFGDYRLETPVSIYEFQRLANH
jgi:GWxTD domain-containing protein